VADTKGQLCPSAKPAQFIPIMAPDLAFYTFPDFSCVQPHYFAKLINA
jgi:hypothetical protein